nr:hypothetical protein HAGR004_09630 [Bdellovibrio sp. HAGR004]
MKRLRPIFKKLEGIFLKEISADEVQEIRYMTEYQVNYYEAVVIDRRWPLSVREALDCVDFVVLHERDPRCYEYWPRMAVLFKGAMDYLKANTGIWEDPIFGQGMYEMKEIKPRYEFKQRILRGHAESLGFVVV